jgi:hypothetical protein
MAAGLMVVFVLVQMALGLLFLIWVWILRVRSPRGVTSDKREGLLWLGVISFTLGVPVDFYFMLAHGSSAPYAKFTPLTSFSLACIGIVLALLGKGRGRIVTAVACCGLALSWLPFILP